MLVPALLALVLGLPAARAQEKGGSTGDGPATVVVENRLGTAVAVWINGELKGTVEPAGQARYDRVPSGRVDVRAGISGGGPVASEQRTLAPGETFQWTLYPLPGAGEEKGTGTVVLENRLEVAVDVSLGDAQAGRLAPGATRAYARVVAGQVVAVARDEAGEVVQERPLTIEPGQIARWEIGAPETEEREAAAGAGR